jgi:hypothetical protein
MDQSGNIFIDENVLTLDIPEIGKSLYMPLNLNACVEREYILMCRLLCQLEFGEINENDFRTMAVYGLLDIKKGSRKILDGELDRALSTIANISRYIYNYFTVEDTGPSVKLSYQGNAIEYITVFRDRYYGPKGFFADVTFGEYEEGLNVFLEYNRTKNMSLLVRLLAIFYRKKNKSLRRHYNESRVEMTMEIFSGVDVGILYGFYYTFASFHMYFSSSSVTWEGKVIDMSIIFNEQPGDQVESYESPYPSLGLKGILFQLAESGVFGNDKQVRKTLLWEAALRLYDIRKRDLDNKSIHERKNENDANS